MNDKFRALSRYQSVNKLSSNYWCDNGYYANYEAYYNIKCKD